MNVSICEILQALRVNDDVRRIIVGCRISRANQYFLDREITYLLRDIDRKRDTADMRSEAEREEREETEKKTRKTRKGFSHTLS